ncbi:hypothetical protein D3C85_1179370 [compost metagenome]
MQAIAIKYAGPTNTKGARMIASAAAGRQTFSYRYELDSEQNAIEAAKAYAKSKDWSGKMAIGQDAKGDWQAVFIKEWTEFEVV